MKLSISPCELSIIDFPLTVVWDLFTYINLTCYEGSLCTLTKKAKRIFLLCLFVIEGWNTKDDTPQSWLIDDSDDSFVFFFFFFCTTGNSRRWGGCGSFNTNNQDMKLKLFYETDELCSKGVFSTGKTMFSKKDSLVLSWLLSCDLVLQYKQQASRSCQRVEQR